MTLYEITDNMRQLMELLDEENEYSGDFVDIWESAEGELANKVNTYCKLIKMYSKEAENIKEEKERLQKRQQAAERKAQQLKSMLVDNLQAVGYDKYKTDLFTLYSFKKKLSKYSTADVPEQFKIEKVSKVVDEAKLKAALDENGGNLGFVKYISNCTIR